MEIQMYQTLLRLECDVVTRWTRLEAGGMGQGEPMYRAKVL